MIYMVDPQLQKAFLVGLRWKNELEQRHEVINKASDLLAEVAGLPPAEFKWVYAGEGKPITGPRELALDEPIGLLSWEDGASFLIIAVQKSEDLRWTLSAGKQSIQSETFQEGLTELLGKSTLARTMRARLAFLVKQQSEQWDQEQLLAQQKSRRKWFLGLGVLILWAIATVLWWVLC